MPITKTGTVNSFPLWEDKDNVQTTDRYSAIPTAAVMKSKSLFGIPLFSSFTRQTLSDEAIEMYIKEAISEVEMSTGLFITPVMITERHDYDRAIWQQSFAYIKLYHPNVLDVWQVQLSFANIQENDLSSVNTGFIDFPREYVFFMPQESTLQLVPAYGTTIGGFLLSAFSGVQYYALVNLGLGKFPGAFRVKYRCGFEKDKIPAAVAALIEVTAALAILSNIAPLLFPYTSVSVSSDGLGQSTGSLGPNWLRGRLGELEKRKADLLAAVKTEFQRTFLIDYV